MNPHEKLFIRNQLNIINDIGIAKDQISYFHNLYSDEVRL